MEHAFPRGRRVAYFSMEMALLPGIPTYSGGLGVLAGDLMRSAADLSVPMVGVTLVSRSGHFRQELSGGRQLEHPEPWQPERFAQRLPTKVSVRIGAREVWIAGWQFEVEGHCAGSVPVPILLLDTRLAENHPDDRALTDVLYGGDEAYRLRQEIVLGVGGARLLQAVGAEVARYHLNEGHAAFLGLELLRRERAAGRDLASAVAEVRSQCVFTTHTPVPAGHDQFDPALARALLGELCDVAPLADFAGPGRLNMTRLALTLSGWVNGVAQRHAETSRALFPGYRVHAITNGVHPWTWASDAHRALFTRHIPSWCHEPELLMHADRIPLPEIAQAHLAAKRQLMARVAGAAGFGPSRFTIGFARRMTAYKRPHLLFTDLERLAGIAARYPVQVVLAGKAHPHDEPGRQHIAMLHEAAHRLAGRVPVVFLPGYDMELARLMVAGVDLWLNTPQPPLEASGTSGMKAALNGVPSLSVLDGWWLEGWSEGRTGWAIGNGQPADADDAASLYEKLEHAVLPLFHQGGDGWWSLARATIARNGAFFNSHRMLRRYALEAYSGRAGADEAAGERAAHPSG